MAHYTARTIDAPIGEINMTPLIDVLLVLLIMFILILPVVTHKVPITLPSGVPGEGPTPPIHRLNIAPSGAVFWDGAAIGEAALTARLEALASDPAHPLLVVDADGAARYERVDELLAVIARAHVERMAFADNQRFAGVF